jgi:hypothetical protein
MLPIVNDFNRSTSVKNRAPPFLHLSEIAYGTLMGQLGALRARRFFARVPEDDERLPFAVDPDHA